MNTTDLDNTIENLSYEQSSQKVARLEWELKNKEAHVQLLLEAERRLQRELDQVKKSRVYRLIEQLRRTSGKLIPFGSKRRFCVSFVIHFLRHPIVMIRKGSLRKQYKEYHASAMSILRQRDREQNEDLEAYRVLQKDTMRKKVIVAEAKDKSEYQVCEVPQFDNPEISIIIPVYNQFNYTYHCIKSIIANSGEISYEILVANDCSTDITSEMEEIIHGVRLITNETNLRFLKNCNHAAEHAKGKYVLFLNNDTLVKEDWLQPLVDLFEHDEKVGLVGSKLIYPNGSLQEAGGIIWRDGSAWNYGNGDDAEASEYNYVKEVDYISGAAIMLPRTLWNEIGGFDEYFAPAYCEDSDLAFMVREKGYKVMYQPKSVVVHFEGVSNGTDLSDGQKAYQRYNQRKFVQKWRRVLRRYPVNGVDVFHAREHSYDKPTLLMVDHYVPQYDKDAGSRTVFQYLRLFVSQGYNVKFIGDNFYRHEPYTTVLQQMGVEVLYGPYYANNWKRWIEGNAAYIDFVFLNRPHISEKYIDFIKEKTSAHVIYYGHDLHFLRETREYELTHDDKLLISMEEWKQKEFSLMRKADMSYYPSYVEQEAIHAIDEAIAVKAIPAYIFEDVDACDYSFSDRQDLMFIGGFGHTPNIDAVKWLAADIMPKLTEVLPGIIVHVLGSNPPDEVKRLESKNLKIVGFVTDEQLEEFYHKCRISIVPLRYGAGIKGKIVESMKYGTPVATTSVGAEGLADAEKVMVIEDDAVAFAKRITDIYQDEQELVRMSGQSIDFVRKNFSPQNALEVISEDF